MQTRKNLADKEKTMGIIGNKIFILHGWTYSTEKWIPFIEVLKKNGLEVHMLNIPGLTEKLDKVWDIKEYVEWLRKKIDSEHVNNETMKQSNNKVILIGHSNGGRITLNFAVKYPEKLSNLILIDSSGIYHNELSLKIKRLIFGSIAKVGKKLTSSERLRSLLYKIVGEKDYKKASPIMKKTLVNLVNSDRFLNLNKITIPTLIVWGEGDKTTPLSDGKLMNKLIKKSKLHIIDGARHSPQFSHTKIVISRIYEELVSRHSGER